MKLPIELLAEISPGAADYAKDKNWHYYLNSPDEESICIGIQNGESSYIFANLSPEEEQVYMLMLKSALQAQIDSKDCTEKYFNCHGKNHLARALATDMGYKLDMCGYHMELKGVMLKRPIDLRLCRRAYEESQLDGYIELFGSAYKDLMLANGWDPAYYSRNREAFGNFLEHSAEGDCLWGWYLDDRLLGIGLIDGSYIRDLAVDPAYQGQGIGSMILANLVQTMLDRGLEPIRLRVAENNYGPIGLYQKLGFEIISHFAEHYLS